MPSSSMASRAPWVRAWEPIATPPASRARISSGETRRWLLLPSQKHQASESVVTNRTAGTPSSRRIGKRPVVDAHAAVVEGDADRTRRQRAAALDEVDHRGERHGVVALALQVLHLGAEARLGHREDLLGGRAVGVLVLAHQAVIEEAEDAVGTVLAPPGQQEGEPRPEEEAPEDPECPCHRVFPFGSGRPDSLGDPEGASRFFARPVGPSGSGEPHCQRMARRDAPEGQEQRDEGRPGGPEGEVLAEHGEGEAGDGALAAGPVVSAARATPDRSLQP